MKHKRIVILLLIFIITVFFSQIHIAQIDARAIDGVSTNIINIKPEISAPFINPSQVAIITYNDIGTNFDINDC